MDSVREHLIDEAIFEAEQGLSQRVTAAKYSIALGTLNYRIHGKKARSEAFKHHPLSPVQESFIADWALNEEGAVFGPLKSYFREATKALAGFTAAAAINERRFLYCYRDALTLGTGSSDIRSGFRETGIWPYKPEKVMGDPEAVLDHDALTATPPRPQEAHLTTASSPI
ncbi:hypothetical protein B0H63DRAFT_564158 [Podospora didyma]|uniref:HTH psq-type domain-containing protein n=1 Tax=Podospora didyma TaxID=330526 RepID=A0AAE0K4M5_9PEZI|nr:hypothetical protein B0H63DRAFT_564158 [Podospora didyma]